MRRSRIILATLAFGAVMAAPGVGSAGSPEPPTGLGATVTADGISAQWNRVQGRAWTRLPTYKVAVWDSERGGEAHDGCSTAANSCRLADGHLTTGSTYYASVRARQAGPEVRTDWSRRVPFVFATTPGRPAVPSVTPIPRGLSVRWQQLRDRFGFERGWVAANGSNIQRYHTVVLNPRNPGGEPVARCTYVRRAPRAACRFEGLANRTYLVQTQAENGVGRGLRSGVTEARPLYPPASPDDLLVNPPADGVLVHGDAGRAIVDWRFPMPDATVTVRAWSAARGGARLATCVASPPPAGRKASKECTLGGLRPGAPVWVDAVAANAAGASAPTARTRFVPSVPPSAPLAVGASRDRGPNHPLEQMTVRWNPAPGNGGASITRYEVRASISYFRTHLLGMCSTDGSGRSCRLQPDDSHYRPNPYPSLAIIVRACNDVAFSNGERERRCGDWSQVLRWGTLW